MAYNISMFKGLYYKQAQKHIVYRLWPYRMHNHKATKPMELLYDFISICDRTLLLLLTHPKVSIPFLKARCTLQASLLVGDSQRSCLQPQVCPYGPGSSSILYPSVCWCVPKSITIIRALPFLLKFPKVWLLGQITLIITNNCKRGRCGDTNIFCHHHKISLWKHEKNCIM